MKLENIVKQAVNALGFELWGVEFQAQDKRTVLRVYVEGEQGFTIDDCVRVSRQISAVLDVEDPIAVRYELEVSSPGIDRPLFSIEQYRRFLRHVVKLRLKSAQQGRKNFLGKLSAVEGGEVTLEVEGECFTFSIDQVEKARLVPEF